MRTSNRSLLPYHFCPDWPRTISAASNVRRRDNHPVLFHDLLETSCSGSHSCSRTSILIAALTCERQLLGETGQVAFKKGHLLVGLIHCALEKLPTFLTLRSLSSEHIYNTEPALTSYQNLSCLIVRIGENMALRKLHLMQIERDEPQTGKLSLQGNRLPLRRRSNLQC